MNEATEKNWRSGGLNTPYRLASAEWDRRMGNAVIQAKNWRLATFATLLFVVLPSIVGLVILGMRPSVVPHIVEIGADGSVAYKGRAGISWDKYKPDDAAILYHLHRYINDTRTLSSDPAVIKQNWLDAYKLLTPRAANILNAYAEENDPFKMAQEMRVSIDILGSVRISDDSIQVEWKETSWGQTGAVIDTKVWRGIFKIIFKKPETEDALIKNPLGLYIDEFHWQNMKQS